MKLYRVLLTLLLLYILSGAYAQTVRLANFGINDGLSQSMVNCMLQDSQGFMWIGTGDGLNRYDGTQCVVYKNRVNDHRSLSNNMVRRIIEDREGNIWVGTDGGLNRYDRKTNRFHRIISKAYYAITPLIVEHDSLVWFLVHGKGLGFYNLKSKSTRLFYNEKRAAVASTIGSYECVALPVARQYYIGSNKGLIRFTTDAGHPACVEDSLFKHFVSGAMVNDIILNGQEIWISSDNATICYDTSTKRYVRYNEIMHICKGRGGRIWGASARQVACFDRKQQRFVPLSIDHETDHPELIKSLYEDQSGNLWIGTDGKGAYIHSPSRNKFAWYNTSTTFNNTTQKLSADFIKSLAKDQDGRLWVGTYAHGLNVVDVERNKLFPVNNAWLGKQIIHYLYADGPVIWLGTETGLYTCNTRTFETTKVAGIAEEKIYYITRLRNGRMALGTYNGVYLQTDKGSFAKIPGSNFKATRMYEDRNGKLWIATGYYTYTAEAPYESVKRGIWKLNGNEMNDFSSRSFVEDEKGILWIGGKNGLIRYDQEKNTRKLYTEDDGLPDAMIYCVIRDTLGKLWMSTNRGISCFDPRTGVFVNYTMEDGLQSNEFNSGAYFKDSKGVLYFGGVNGFNIIDPLNIPFNKYYPKVSLTRLKLFDEDYAPGTNYTELKAVELKHSENTLSFEFAAMDFSNPEKNEYSYKLEGADEGWVKAGTKRFARYANLPPGKYVFSVVAKNNDGIRGLPGELLYITIASPWWLTWWAITGFILVIAALTYFTIRYIIRQKLEKQQREMEKLHAVNLERTRISKDMHDDLGSGLSRIAVMSELLKHQQQQDNHEEVEKISKAANDLIDNMSHIIWAMNPENDHISNLLAYIREHAVEFVESCGLQCELSFPGQAPEMMLTQEARRNIFLVVKESLNNIVKHASAKQVCISVKIESQQMVLSIKDDGKGFDPEKARRNGNGLRNMKKRMEQVNGGYEVASELGRGTITVISVTA
jgi:ligand-binding sensor domain-containing protein/signal transduction histidine kinase